MVGGENENCIAPPKPTDIYTVVKFWFSLIHLAAKYRGITFY